MLNSPVTVRHERVVLPTYEPLAPDLNPMFLEKRVYQGSSGKVYPLPFYNRIAETKTDRSWKAVYIENEFIQVMVLPELGGRIHVGQDKTNGYDFFYRQTTIKPALVGLAGPWASGGVEFNWPQHHRPATFMPVEVEVENHLDGSKTVWLSDHDPMERMKGMHGVCLHPGRSVIELKMRAYNRTPLVQTFLWWANVATHVHEGYQSFFPPDVSFVADHAKRAMSRFPLCDGQYYGVDYAKRARDGVPPEEIPPQFVPPYGLPDTQKPAGIPNYAPNDLSWYANIPVPTSYMCIGSQQDFSGGYDYKRQAGLVQVSNHHISPGKKQWTWGNHPFGYAWDRNLTDGDGPYIELMLGVYTDNQPDFSFLQPGETKAWSVFWYPLQKIGPAQQANARAAVSLQLRDQEARIGIAATEVLAGASVLLKEKQQLARTWIHDFAPDRPFVDTVSLTGRVEDLEVTLVSAAGEEVISYRPQTPAAAEIPAPATEPAAPGEVSSADELYLIGLHLSQYRHATRDPMEYWREALRRDPGDARCNHAVGLWHLRRGEAAEAERFFRAAIARLTSRNPNPYDGEPFYHLGLVLRFLKRDDEAYAAFYKAVWNQAWQGAGYHALAEIDCVREEWAKALDHLNRSLRLNTDNLRARNLRVVVLRKLERNEDAERGLAETRALDPLDAWARWLDGQELNCDNQIRLDLALDYARAGLWEEAIRISNTAAPEPLSGTGPLVAYYLSYIYEEVGNKSEAERLGGQARERPLDYCFPARLEEISILKAALARCPEDARAAYYLGNLLYDKRRYEEAIGLWEQSARLDPTCSIVWRNLGIGYFNVRRDPTQAREAYARAFAANPRDARLLYERDQLWKRLGENAAVRLAELEAHRSLALERDDTAVELCALYNQTGCSEQARQVLTGRRFQPWEGGEGQALGQWTRTHLLLAREAMQRGDADAAIPLLESARTPPELLGEAKHLLANQSDLYYWLGEACQAAGEAERAREYWRKAAASRGDFQQMSLRAYSEMTYFSARALERLNRKEEARDLFSQLRDYALRLEQTPAKIDYFATSLPTMLLFEDDLQARQSATAWFLQAQAAFGLGECAAAEALLQRVLRHDPSHAPAGDLLREVQQHEYKR